jgi:hypothetical protein
VQKETVIRREMEQLFADAKAKGMHVVEEGKLHLSYSDYEIIVKEAEELCDVTDPEETPYKSKYDARAKLDALCNRMEANRTIASLEKNKEVIDELDWRIAATRTRLGSIAWEVEEPHNAQIELDMAAVRIIILVFAYNCRLGVLRAWPCVCNQ